MTKYNEDVVSGANRVLGQTLIDIALDEDGTADCGREITLHFTGGKELSIYIHPQLGLTIEED